VRLVTLTLALGLLILAGAAWAGRPLYRTDRQAETYLEHGVRPSAPSAETSRLPAAPSASTSSPRLRAGR